MFPKWYTTGLQKVAGLGCPVYGGNFIKDPMDVRQGNELLSGLYKGWPVFGWPV